MDFKITEANQDSSNDSERREFIYPFVKGKELPWKDEIVPNHIIPFIRSKRQQGSKPTVRGVLYFLESKRIIPKNDFMYKRIVRVLSNARRGWKRNDGTRGSPMIAMDAFADNTRKIIKDFKDEERSLNDYIEDGIHHFKMLPSGFQMLVPRWLNQRNYVEVWVEKDAMAQDVYRALRDRHIVIAPNRGHVSITFIHENIERIVDQFIEQNRDKVYILYLGDLDPRGWDMDRLIKEDLARETKDLLDKDGNPAGSRFIFKRIGITRQQIEDYNLKHLMYPDPETLKKLKKDTNLAGRFIKEFGSLFQVELDAFQLIDFAEFERLITFEIDSLYDYNIRNQVLGRPEYSQEPYEIKQQIVQELGNLINELKD